MVVHTYMPGCMDAQGKAFVRMHVRRVGCVITKRRSPTALSGAAAVHAYMLTCMYTSVMRFIDFLVDDLD